MAPKSAPTMAAKKKGKKDIAWEHCVSLHDNRLHVKCNYCPQTMWGGTFRVKHHLVGTHQEVALCSQVPEDVKNLFTKILGKKEKKEDDTNFFEEETLTPGSQNKGSMDAFVMKGKGGPRQQTLNEMIKDSDIMVRDICRCLNNNALPFNLVKSHLFTQMVKSLSEYGRCLKPPSYHEIRVTYLKKEVDDINTRFDSIKDAEKMFELLDSMIDEIRKENVAQVVTDSAAALVVAGKKLMEKKIDIFWTPCAAHCLDLVFEDIVLRLVDGDSKPSMCYIYEAMDRANEQITNNLNNVESKFKKVWKIIDKRWNYQLHRPLHAAGYYLNPRLHYESSFSADTEVMIGLYKVMDKFAPEIETRVKIIGQLAKFDKVEGMLGYDLAIATRNKMQPALWWSSFGVECKELQTFVIRVLSLTCSATGCERNWSVFEHIHSKKRNHLEQQRLNALVFVKYNLNLESRQKIREEKGETYDHICLSDMESDDDEWITEREESCLHDLELQSQGDKSWMDVQECFNIEEGAPNRKRKRGPRNINVVIVSKKDKGKDIQVAEVDDGDEDEDDEEVVVVDDSTQAIHDFDDLDL
ncbi:hypothetical protein Cni_G14366 [Canna indica]|uniref:BED-type domain-containing protein n=1 Tax=Canna indica TaxID=4628 RepID=A0AAQ3KC19_9LILI|nr:hypothetical protein Cni_G14366 [Canna indica]